MIAEKAVEKKKKKKKKSRSDQETNPNPFLISEANCFPQLQQ